MQTRRKKPPAHAVARALLAGFLAVLLAARPGAGAASRGAAMRPRPGGRGNHADRLAGARWEGAGQGPQPSPAAHADVRRLAGPGWEGAGPPPAEPPQPAPRRPPARGTGRAARGGGGGGGGPAPDHGRARRQGGPAAYDAASLQTAVRGWCTPGAAVAGHAGRLQCPADAGKHVCCNNKCVTKGYEGDGDNDCGDNSDEDGRWSTCHDRAAVAASNATAAAAAAASADTTGVTSMAELFCSSLGEFQSGPVEATGPKTRGDGPSESTTTTEPAGLSGAVPSLLHWRRCHLGP